MHGHELHCSYVDLFQVFSPPADCLAGYLMTGAAKVLIAVTLFLLESLLPRARLTRFLYSEVAL